MTSESIVAFSLAAAALALVPGPTVTVIIANSLRYGARAGLMNVLGTQAGFVIWLVIAQTGIQDIDNFATFVFWELLCKCLAQEKWGTQIDGKKFLPQICITIFKCIFFWKDSCVVNENIDMAKMGNGRWYNRSHSFCIGEIGMTGDSTDAFFNCILFGLLGWLGRTAVMDKNITAGFC